MNLIDVPNSTAKWLKLTLACVNGIQINWNQVLINPIWCQRYKMNWKNVLIYTRHIFSPDRKWIEYVYKYLIHIFSPDRKWIEYVYNKYLIHIFSPDRKWIEHVYKYLVHILKPGRKGIEQMCLNTQKNWMSF